MDSHGRTVSRALLLTAAAFLLATAFMFRRELKYSVTIQSMLSRQPQAHMNMVNAKGDRDFFCLSRDCDDQGGFQGRQSGYLYANRIDAVKGNPMRTRQ